MMLANIIEGANLILLTILREMWYYYYSHVIHKEIENQRSYLICPRLHPVIGETAEKPK